MRKTVSIISIIIVLSVFFASCGNDGDNNPLKQSDPGKTNLYTNSPGGSFNTPSPSSEEDEEGNFSFITNLSGQIIVKETKGLKFHGEQPNPESKVIITKKPVNFSFTFEIKDGWRFSEEYSYYPKSNNSSFTNNGDNTFTFTYQADSGKEMLKDEFEKIHFVSVPEDTVNNGVPTLLINTKNYQDIEDKVTWVEAVYAIVEGDKKEFNTENQKGTMLIKGRGNTSWNTIELQDKRPYTIKLDESMEVLGMPQNRDWVLVANHSDKSLMRNYISYTIGAKMEGFKYTPRCAFAEVYLNNEYKGLYLITEKIEAANEKVDIVTTKKGDNLTDIMAGSFLVEKESRDRFNDEHQLLVQGVETVIGTLNIKSPGNSHLIKESRVFRDYVENQYSDPVKNYIARYFNETNKAISAIRHGDYESYKKYIDVNSFIDYIIFQEVVKNIDGNMKVSIFFYKDKGGKMAIGPIWDFDISYGNADYRNGRGPMGDDPYGFMVLDAVWFRDLLEDPDFYKALKERYKELRNSVFKEFIPTIDNTAKYIKKAAESNFERHDVLDIRLWPNPLPVIEANSFDKQVDYLKNWINNRLKWLDDQWL